MKVSEAIQQADALLNHRVEIEGIFVATKSGDEFVSYIASNDKTLISEEVIALDLASTAINAVAPLHRMLVSNKPLIYSQPTKIIGQLERQSNNRLRLTRISKLSFTLNHTPIANLLLEKYNPPIKEFLYESIIEYGTFLNNWGGTSNAKVTRRWTANIVKSATLEAALPITLSDDFSLDIYSDLFGELVTIRGYLRFSQTTLRPFCLFPNQENVSVTERFRIAPINWNIAYPLINQIVPEHEPIPYLHLAKFTGILCKSSGVGYLVELCDIRRFVVYEERYI
jgi:hypothetical protein